MSIAGVAEAEARAAGPAMADALRREPGVAAEAAWDAGASALLVTVEADVAGPNPDADEAANFHRVWRAALAHLKQDPPRLRFDIEGSLETSEA